MRQRRFASAALLALLAAAGAAQAAGNLLLIEAPPARDTLSLGASVWRLPQYPGARASDTWVLPALDYATASGLFVSTDYGVGWNFSPTKTVQAGVRLWPQFGRSSGDGPAGLQPVGLRIQAQGYANVLLADVVLLQSGLLYGAGRERNGVQLELGATSGVPLGPVQIGLGLSATWADANFRQSYFGVSGAEAQASGLRATTLGGGQLDTALTLSAEAKFDERWRLSGQLVLARLAGEVARSPLVQQRRQTSATLTLWRSF
jgi:outer membrane scaffolding protein for murein synthesis (MipA/OmpV family)